MIILVGASATGKSVVVKRMQELYGIEKVVTYTTRSMRMGEINGLDYHFISKEEFCSKIEKNFFLETAFYNNNYYGTAFEDISKNKALIVEPNGANVYYDKLKEKVFIVYLNASCEARKNRMIERGDSLENIEKRMKSDIKYFDIGNLRHVDLVVDTEEITIDQIVDIIYNKYKKLFLK